MVESTAKLREEILALTGVDIMDGANQFKSTYAIMDELAAKWQDLTDIQQASVTELIAGKRQGNIVSSLMSNFDIARNALNTSLESSGSAMKEHAKWSESLEARLLKLKATWQSFAQTFMDSDLLKVGIETLKVLLNILDELIKNLGSFGTIGLGVGIKGIINHFKNVKTVVETAKEAAKAAGEDVLAAGINAEKGAKGFKSFFSTFSGKAAVIGAVISVVALLYNQYKKAKEAAAELRQETIAASDEYLNAASTFEKAYIKYSGKTDLTTEEEAELTTAIQGTVDVLGDKSSALQTVVNSSDDYVNSLERIAKEERKIAKEKAEEKRKALEENLIESAMGWERFDGSEVDVNFGLGITGNYDKAEEIAKVIASDYFAENAQGNNGEVVYSLTLDSDADINEILDYYYTLIELKSALEDGLTEDELKFDYADEYDRVTDSINKMTEAVKAYTDGLYEAIKMEYDIPKTLEDFLDMRESILRDPRIQNQSFDYRLAVANSLDSDYKDVFDLSSVEAQARSFVGLIKNYGDGTKDGTNEIGAVETFLNMRTAINNKECTVGDYISQYNEISKLTTGWNDEEKELFNSSFGFDADSIKNQYDEAYDYITSKHLNNLDTSGLTSFQIDEYKESEREKIENFLGGLSKTELAAFINIKPELDFDSGNFEDIMAQIEKEAALIEAISFKVDLELETEKLENLSTAISESISGAGLGDASISIVEDMFGDLDSYDQSKLFERTANGIRLNSDELRKLNDEYKKTNVDGLNDKIDALGERYNQTKEELYGLTYGTDEYNQKAKDLKNIEDQINAAEKLASQYEGLASAYQTWQRAEAAGSQRDMYETMLEGLENVDDELSRGWLDDGTIEFLRLIKGDTLSAVATTKELKAAYDSLDDTIKHTTYSVRDFFTVDEDGNSTNDGVYNFLDAIGQMEEEKFGGKDVVKRDGKGNIIGFDFDIVGGDEAIAEALGISEELVQIMVRAADDAGFVVSMDGTYQQLDILKEKASDAAKELKETFKVTNHSFFEDGSEEGVLSDYQEAMKIWETFSQNKNKDGTIDMSVEGAEEAYTLVSTLQSMVDQLAEPVYMELNSSQVEKDMQKPLEKLQEYERLTQQEHQLQLKGTDTSDLDKTQEEIIDYFEGLSPEIKAELGIEGLTREEIQAKVEAGEIEIPATIDLQVEMNDTLRDMVNVALYNAGLIDEDELEKRVDITLYADEIDDSNIDEEVENTVKEEEGKKTTLEKVVEITGLPIMSTSANEIADLIKGYTDEKQQIILEFIVENEEEFEKYTKEEKEAVVKLIADSENIDNWQEKDIEAVIKYFVDDGDVSQWSPEAKYAFAKYLVDGGDPDKFDPDDKESWVVYGTDTTKPDGYVPDNPNATVIFDKDTSVIDSYSPTVTGFVSFIANSLSVPQWIKDKLAKVGISIATGTANINGTAFANGSYEHGKSFKRGDWRTKKAYTALTGELGREIVVTPNNQWYTVGDSGAEFANIPKGSIVFNHKQTEELLNNGKTTSGGGRAKALASGTAFSSGSGGIGRTASGKKIEKLINEQLDAQEKKESKKKSSSSSSSSYSSGSNGKDGVGKSDKGSSVGSDKSSSSSSSKEDFEEVIDWIETSIDRIERDIDMLEQKAGNIFKSWSERNKALTGEISNVRDEINLQQQAYSRYMQEAESIGLSSSYAEKVRNGTIDIETIKDEALKEKIDDYQNWYDKALDAEKAIEELKETEASLYKQRFENVSTRYDGVLGVIEHEKNMLEEYINQSETQGWLVSYEYYRALSSNEKRNIEQLEKQKADMLAELQTAMESGTITKYSEAWYDLCGQIDEVSLSIEEANTRVMEISQNAQQLKWEQFDLLQDKISSITDETEFLIELLSNDKLYDDNGKFTDAGMAVMGQHGVAYNTHMQQADLAAAEAERIKAELAKDPYDTELEERYREMIALQQEHILAAESEKEAIRDMVEEGIQLELDALQERIDKYNEALDSQKDLYEYQKKVKEQTKEIASLEKQLAAYSGDTSEEAKQKIQQIKVDLESAREELKETEYDKYISDQQQMLDELYVEYEEILNTRLDNIDALLSDMIAEINANASTISSTLAEKADSVGYTLSDSMKTIWDSNTVDTTNVITTYGEKFSSAQTTTNNALGTINTNLQNMIAQLNKLAKTNVKSASISSAENSDEANTPQKDKKQEDKKPEDKKPTPEKKTIKVGGKIDASGAKIYEYAGDKSGERQLYRNDPIYVVLAEKSGYLQVRHHKLSSGVTGWFKKGDVKAYSSGKKNFLGDETAWTQDGGREFIVRPSDGAILTPIARGDSVLNAAASNNIWNMANSPADFIKSNLNLGSSNVPNNTSVHGNYTQHLDKVIFNLPNVKNYDELLSAMQKDKNFERLILSMSIDRIAGKSSLAKGKSIR